MTVDFSLFDDTEPGDVIKVRFTLEAFDSLNTLLFMEDHGDISMPPSVTGLMRVILERRSWGMDPSNRSVEVTLLDTFARFRFEDRLRHRIDELTVVSRQRPLVDTAVLASTGASVRYRFKTDGLPGAKKLLELNDMSLVQLGNEAGLEHDVTAGVWGSARSGRFTTMLSAEAPEYTRMFELQVLPHLELLRCP